MLGVFVTHFSIPHVPREFRTKALSLLAIPVPSKAAGRNRAKWWFGWHFPDGKYTRNVGIYGEYMGICLFWWRVPAGHHQGQGLFMNMSPVDYWEQFRHATGGCHSDTSGEPHGVEEIEGRDFVRWRQFLIVFVEYSMISHDCQAFLELGWVMQVTGKDSWLGLIRFFFRMILLIPMVQCDIPVDFVIASGIQTRLAAKSISYC